MGSEISKIEEVGDQLPEEVRFFGLQNFGNTCYCNSVIQVLFHNEHFRTHVIAHYEAKRALREEREREEEEERRRALALNKEVPQKKVAEKKSGFWSMLFGKEDEEEKEKETRSSDGYDLKRDHLLEVLGHLFYVVATRDKRSGVIKPRGFVNSLRSANELFEGFMHQDAQEFFSFLINSSGDYLQDCQKQGERELEMGKDGVGEKERVMAVNKYEDTLGKTFIHDVFEGVLLNETKCLCCETQSTKEEAFLELSVDVQQNISISACLYDFFGTELLRSTEKFFCNMCNSLQEASKRTRVKRLPKVLVVHLKRFKYVERLGSLQKLAYRVAFPSELRLPELAFEGADGCSAESETERDVLYRLYGIVVHLGQGPHHGHYISIINCHGHWVRFDDDRIDLIEEEDIEAYYGASGTSGMGSSCGYMLFYERFMCDHSC